jgi:hypothetical protein
LGDGQAEVGAFDTPARGGAATEEAGEQLRILLVRDAGYGDRNATAASASARRVELISGPCQASPAVITA